MAGLFLHEEIYRGAPLLQRLAGLRISICGAGALGSNLADTLARQGAARLRVIDFDRVEEQNVGTQIYGQGDVGAFKVEALRKHLFRATGIEIEPVRDILLDITARKVLKNSELVIDCFDDSTSRSAVQAFARQTNTPALHMGLNTGYCEVIWDGNYRVPEDVGNDVCEYPLARNLVLLAVVMGAESIMHFLENGERIDRSGTLRDLAIVSLERA